MANLAQIEAERRGEEPEPPEDKKHTTRTPRVKEIPRRLQAVTPDSFLAPTPPPAGAH